MGLTHQSDARMQDTHAATAPVNGTGRRMGRPTKLTPEVQKRILAFIRAGNTFRDSAACAGIGESTFFQWKRENPEFLAALKKAEVQFIDRNLAIIQKTANKTWTAAAWLLERRFPERFGRDRKVVPEVEEGLPVLRRELKWVSNRNLPPAPQREPVP